MNYIVFDLEWNQAYGHESENERMPFEIIEIGAVKLNKDFEIIDTFESLIRPKIYKRLQPHIKTILNYDENTLYSSGKPFDMVCRDFIKWCGEDYIFGTWGAMDLYYLQNNMEYYYMKPLPFPLKYLNIQQIYSEYNNMDNVSKLEKAVFDFSIEVDRPFHSAINDAYYTGLVLSKMKVSDLQDKYSFDFFNLPTDEASEIFAKHKNYSEYITREFDERKAILSDTEILDLRCCKCNKKLIKKVKWFANTPNSYVSVGRCWYHGLVLSKIKFKQSKNYKCYAVKTTSKTNKQIVEDLKNRQDELRLKRQIKRQTYKESKTKSKSK